MDEKREKEEGRGEREGVRARKCLPCNNGYLFEQRKHIVEKIISCILILCMHSSEDDDTLQG
jgi:uncharacterized protein (DUF983 family)